MENVFIDKRKHSTFSWDMLGDIKKGREDLGEEMPVLVYRLMQYSLLDILSKEFGEEKANGYFRKAGCLAGIEFAKNVLDLKVDFDSFILNLKNALLDLKIGILRMEIYDGEKEEIQLTVSQDLDCSGLPITNESVCSFDEGFIAGILEVYTGKKYNVYETDCWATGARVCRFKGSPAL